MQKDEYELRLDENLEILTKCQEEMKLNGCFECEKLLECQTRGSYVQAVYDSMSKGVTSDFEFN